MFAVLRRRDFALLWTAGFVSIAGDWMLYAALPYFVFQRTGSTLATAGMTAAELVPSMLLGSVAGVFADRWDRKHLLVACNLAQAVTVLGLFLVAAAGAVWPVYLVGVVAACIAAFASPAEDALLPTLVDEAELVEANALGALNNRLGRLVGLPAGAALLGTLGLDGVIVADAASFAVAATLLRWVAPHTSPSGAGEPVGAEVTNAARAFWREWRDGLSIVRRDRTITGIFMVLGLMTFGGTMLDPVTVAWVRDILHRGADTYALLLTTHAAAGIACSLLIGHLGRHLTTRQLMGWTSVIAGAALAVKYNLPTVSVAYPLTVISGFTSVASSVGVTSLLQQTIPDTHRGRIFGALGTTGALLSLAGAAVAGALAGIVGITQTLDIAAGLVALSGVVVLLAFAGSRWR